MKPLFVLLSLALLFVPTVGKSTELTYLDYAKLPQQSMMVISPSGTRVAYRYVDGGRDLLVVQDHVQKKVMRILDIATVNPSHVYFIDDERLILVASQNTRLWGFRGRHDVSVAFSYNIEDESLHQLLMSGYGIYAGQSVLGSVVGVSSDHKYAYMPAWKNRGNFSLFKVDLTKRRKPRVHAKGTQDTIDFFVGVDGELLARERFNNKKNLHRLQARIDDEWQTIFTDETEIPHTSFVGVTPDRKSIVMLKQDENHGRWAYYTISLQDGKISEPLFSKEDRDVERVLMDINRVVYGVRYSGFKPSYEFFDNKLNKRIRGIAAVLPDEAVTIEDYTPDWSNIVLFTSGNENAGSYIQYKNGGLSMMATSRPEFGPYEVNPVVETAYTARDGMNIPMLLTVPKNKPLKSLPAIMLPHGGPESYDKIEFDWLVQYFSAQGYVVIQPQFRGSKGFGVKHLFAGRGEWGRKMQDDLTDAVQVLVKEGKVDPDKICIVGASYGGYAALAGAVFTPDVYQCVVSINGVSDVARMLRTEKRQYGSDHWVVSYWNRVIADGKVDADHLKAISPVNFADDIKVPVLLIHGTHDLIVPFVQSEEMLDAMEDADKQVTLVELEKGNHYLSKTENRVKALKAIDQFVKSHLQ